MHLLIYSPDESAVIFTSEKHQQTHCVRRRHFFCWLREEQAQTRSTARRYMHKYSWLCGDRQSLSSTPAQTGSTPHSPDHQRKRNPIKITTLLQPRATSDFTSAAVRLIYSRSALLPSHRSPRKAISTPTPQNITFPLLSIEHLHHPTSSA